MEDVMEYSQQVSVNTLRRLPLYLNYLKNLDAGCNISSTELAKVLGLNDVQVRKDLSSVSKGGRPKIGYNVGGLVSDLKQFLGYNSLNEAVMVGCGNLGRALMSYKGFEEYGLRIVAGFDSAPSLIGSEVAGKRVLDISSLSEYCRENGIKIGVITTPASSAQGACELLIKGGVKAVWNFAPAHISVGEGILVQNENMAASLALLSKHLNEMLDPD